MRSTKRAILDLKRSVALWPRKKHRDYVALLVAFFICCHNVTSGQNAASRTLTPAVISLADSLIRLGNVQPRIFYVHGIGANGPNDHDSKLLRTSICRFLKDCTTKEGVLEGSDYADRHSFSLNAPPPNLKYLGEPVWRNTYPGGPSEQFNASAPYVDHWKLERKNGTVIHVDEINWWPLVFALKCREIVAKDATLLGPNAAYIDLCSQSIPDRNQPGRFRLYPWISADEAKRLKALPPKGASLNRGLKNNLLDWRFSDALLAVGEMQSLMLEGVRQLVLKSVSAADNNRQSRSGGASDQEFVFVTHSLGSYLIFSALDLKSGESDTSEMKEWRVQFRNILSHTPLVYFFANQLRLLELANLDASGTGKPSGNMIDHLQTWSKLRMDYLAGQALSNRTELVPPSLVSWNDPSDLLTWNVPEVESASGQRILVVENHSVRNAIDWFGLLEGPTGAHDNYASNKRIIRSMLKPTQQNLPRN